MRTYLTILFCTVLVGCSAGPEPSNQTTPTQPTAQTGLAPEKTVVRRSADAGIANYRSVSRVVEPVAERVCREFSQGLPRSFCDFVILVDSDPRKRPNAFQSIGKDGRPTLTFTVSMLRTVKNNQEIAFILSHEAGHQIARHLLQRQRNVQAGALLGGLLIAGLGGDPQAGVDLGATIGSRAYSKEFETQADRLATHIAYRAGYDPLIGARAFARTGGSNSLLSTHPPGPQRYQTVVNEMAYIRANGGRRAQIRW